jgi:hypothetical protein
VTATIPIVEIAKSTGNIMNPINKLIKPNSEETLKSTTDEIEFTNDLNRKNNLETFQSESQIINNNEINSQALSIDKNIDNKTDINLSIINENIETFKNETDILNTNNSDIEEETSVIKSISTSSTFLFSEMTTLKPTIDARTTRITKSETIISSSPFTDSNLNSTISSVNIQSSTKALEPIIVSKLLAYLFLNLLILLEGLEYQYLVGFHKNYY